MVLVCVLALFLGILAVGCETAKETYVPAELMDGGSLHLGQDISELKRTRNVKWFDSGSCYMEKITNNKYFSSVYYRPDEGFLFLGGQTIYSIEFEGPPKTSTVPVEDLAKEVIAVCVKTFGKDYEIVDVGTRSPSRPMLVWESDSCAVRIVYSPSAYLEKRRSENKTAHPELQFDISYSLEEFETKYGKSTVWTRQTLGLE